MTVVRPGILLVLDGWGHAEPGAGNAIAAAATPTLDDLAERFPSGLLDASGSAVGLDHGTVGNSEIGHLVIGAGRPLPYDSVLVRRYLDSGAVDRDPVFANLCAGVLARGATLHLVGLCSSGAIHADVDHIGSLITSATARGVRRISVHAITDGRDVPDGTGFGYLEQVAGFLSEADPGVIATVSGRGYAMSKDGDAEPTLRVVRAIAHGQGRTATTVSDALAGATDTWVPPTVLVDADGRPRGAVTAGDAVLLCNFRSDRIQQLADLLVEHLPGVEFASIAKYDTKTPITALVPRAAAGGGLADELEVRRLRSVRVSVREKFEHVTFYLNGRDARARSTERHVCVGDGAPDPELNIGAVAAEVVAAAKDPGVALVVANLPNIDVIGHTADEVATRRAAEHVDGAVARILRESTDTGRWVMLVGDHGNGERMSIADAAGERRPYGGHTTNPVPVVVVPSDGGGGHTMGVGGTLADVAPTVLTLLGLPAGAAMTGTPLVTGKWR